MVISIIDPLFQRIFESFPWNRNLVFVDSTASLERFNLPSFVFSIFTPYGGLPIAISIVSDEVTDTLFAAFDSLRKMGLTLDMVMTDDAVSLKTAIGKVWPECTQLLCTWHFSQAYWTWIMDGKHKITKPNWSSTMDDVKKLIFAESNNEFETELENFLKKYEGNKKLCDKVKKDASRRNEWAHFYRSNL